MKKIAFLGASVTAQTFAHGTGELTGYVEAFKESHAKKLGFDKVIVRSHPGNRLTDAGMIHAQKIVRAKPDVVILELTIEDRTKGHDFDERHLSYLTGLFIGAGVLPVFFAMPKPDEYDPRENLACKMIRNFSEAEHLPCIMPQLPVGCGREGFFRDGVHTKIEGARFYADKLAQGLSEFFERGWHQNRGYFSFRRLISNWKGGSLRNQWFRMHAKPNTCRFRVRRIPFTRGGEFRSVTIRNLNPKSVGGTICIVQRQEIGSHSPVVDVGVLTGNGNWGWHQLSIWDPYCHYPRYSYVILAKVDRYDFKEISIKVSSTLPNYATCKREVKSEDLPTDLYMRSDKPFWIISDLEIELSVRVDEI